MNDRTPSIAVFVRPLYEFFSTMPSPSKYRRKSLRLNEAAVDDAILLSQDEGIKGMVVEWRDVGTVGLTLRITPNKPIWYLRRREMTIRLADVRDLDLDNARYIAKQIQLAASRGRDLRDVASVFDHLILPDRRVAPGPMRDGFYRELEMRMDEDLARVEKARKLPVRPEAPFWTWKTLTEKFLEYKLPKLKAKYRKAYKHYLELEPFRAIADKMVRDVKLSDLERIRNAIGVQNAKSAVHRAVTQSKRMLSWAWRFHATASGLEELEYEWWNRLSFEYETKERTHAPTVVEIARTLLLAERYAQLDGGHKVYAGTLGALWGIALTAQRTGAFLQLRKDRLFDASKTNRRLRGWKVANWTSDEMKGGRDGGRPHSLPLPEALKVLDRYYAQSGGKSPWMFSGRDPKKHTTAGSLNHFMYRLQGVVWDHTVRQKPQRSGKPGPKPKPMKVYPNLFARYNVAPWTLHDCRRTLTTLLDDKRLGGSATAILGHKTSTSRMSEREKLAPVTEQHYSQSQRIDLKAEGMALWVKTLLAAYEKERPQVP
ncbi:hypothetical protein H8B02_09210 [Bradyrhizobium sp. Pear77]|uniref:hypothetical protein n=1 Tax=Bradyrhizobium altum TaxID=1571202 RepID=UPI001E657DD3|nr:hypothetical protein [Bradyrhizobium altum]MCC8953623.1 hypothetical protein [Bradyrhizobium altum]